MLVSSSPNRMLQTGELQQDNERQQRGKVDKKQQIETMEQIGLISVSMQDEDKIHPILKGKMVLPQDEKVLELRRQNLKEMDNLEEMDNLDKILDALRTLLLKKIMTTTILKKVHQKQLKLLHFPHQTEISPSMES